MRQPRLRQAVLLHQQHQQQQATPAMTRTIGHWSTSLAMISTNTTCASSRTTPTMHWQHALLVSSSLLARRSRLLTLGPYRRQQPMRLMVAYVRQCHCSPSRSRNPIDQYRLLNESCKLIVMSHCLNRTNNININNKHLLLCGVMHRMDANDAKPLCVGFEKKVADCVRCRALLARPRRRRLLNTSDSNVPTSCCCIAPRWASRSRLISYDHREIQHCTPRDQTLEL